MNTTNSTIGALMYSSTASSDATNIIASGIAVMTYTAFFTFGEVIDLSNASTTHISASHTTAATHRYHATS